MLLYAENFNQLMYVSDLIEVFGYYVSSYLYPRLLVSDDFLSTTESTPMFVGDREERCFYWNDNGGNVALPNVQNSRRLVFGLSVGSGAIRSGVSGLQGSYLNRRYFHSTKLAVIFSRRWFDSYQRQNDLFSIEVCFRFNETIDIFFNNYGDSLTDIQPATGIPVNRYRKLFFEFYSDSDGAEDSRGTVKVALNGKTIVVRENVINSDYTKWGGDPSNEGSYYNAIVLNTSRHSLDGGYVGYYISDLVFDYFYICNESGGYYDDFLGPVQVTTMYPDPARPGDVANWVGFKDGVPVSDPLTDPNASIVDTPVIDATATDTDYIEADTENLQDLYYVKNNLDPVRNMLNNPIAVNFRTFIKNIFSYGNDNYDKGLLALTKASGNDVERETGKRIMVDQFTYKPLDVYYGVVPKLAVPWTWELLENMQFGMESSMVRHSIFLGDGVVAFDAEPIIPEDYFQSDVVMSETITETAIYRPMAIGDNVGGDIVFATWTDPVTNEEFYLLAAPATKRTQKTWGTYGFDTSLANITNSGTVDQKCGSFNTEVLRGLGYQAASFCYDIGGYFLPNKDQLLLLAQNKDIIDSADTSGGSDMLSLISGTAWSSSEYSSYSAWYMNMNASWSYTNKGSSYWVLPIRKVLVSEVALS